MRLQINHPRTKPFALDSNWAVTQISLEQLLFRHGDKKLLSADKKRKKIHKQAKKIKEDGTWDKDYFLFKSA